MNSEQAPIIYCFRNDLRISDNPGLNAACETGRPVLPCFILDDITPGLWRTGSASRWWLYYSLLALQNSLHKLGGRLYFRSGSWVEQIRQMALEVDAFSVYWARCYEPSAVKSEAELHHSLNECGIDSRRFGGSLLFEPEQVRTRSNGPFKVFTPFWKTCLQQPEPPFPQETQKNINFYRGELSSDLLDHWRLLPAKPDWAGGLREFWIPGEQGAWHRLENFLNVAITGYQENRDCPALSSTSKLSPYLHFGEISPRQVWYTVQSLAAGDSRLQTGAQSFLRELGWREFSYHLLFHWPHLPEQPFRPKFAEFPWREDSDLMQAWQQGRTGFPLVDAGMRELWHTGWMHNRVRMIAASFLVKNLLQPWQTGEAWFWDTLVDADLANNAASWQWVAGCGADAAPYFRIFNPVIQSEKFDPEGQYIRRWLPELKSISKRYIHAPWTAPEVELKNAGILLGSDYPKPIVDHKLTRQRALNAYKQIKL